MKLDELLETYAYNPQQKNQLKKANKKGLELSYLQDPRLDWEQMREIALALEYGVDPSSFCNPDIPSENMEDIRNTMFENEGVYKKIHEDLQDKKRKRFQKWILTGFITFFVLLIIMWQKPLISSILNDLELVLTEQRVSVSYSRLSSLNMIDFVERYDQEGILELPSVPNGVGEYVLDYALKNQSKNVTRQLTINVIDDIKPVITLKSDIINIKVKSNFNARDYIVSAVDEIAGDVMASLEIDTNVDTLKVGHYTVSYTVKDTSGNIANALLYVNVIANESNTSSGSTSSGSANNNTSSGNTNSNTSSESTSSGSSNSNTSTSNYQPEGKKFLVSIYETFDKCLEECQAYIQREMAKGFVGTAKAQPILQDGVYIGYEAIFTKN